MSITRLIAFSRPHHHATQSKRKKARTTPACVASSLSVLLLASSMLFPTRLFATPPLSLERRRACSSFSLASKPHNHDLLLPPTQHWSSHPHMSLSSSRLALASCGHHRVELPSSFRSDLVSPSHGHTTTQQCRFVHGLFHLVLHLNRVPTASSHFIGETQRPTTKV
jgi:hypothetical protein